MKKILKPPFEAFLLQETCQDDPCGFLYKTIKEAKNGSCSGSTIYRVIVSLKPDCNNIFKIN